MICLGDRHRAGFSPGSGLGSGLRISKIRVPHAHLCYNGLTKKLFCTFLTLLLRNMVKHGPNDQKQKIVKHVSRLLPLPGEHLSFPGYKVLVTCLYLLATVKDGNS